LVKGANGENFLDALADTLAKTTALGNLYDNDWWVYDIKRPYSVFRNFLKAKSLAAVAESLREDASNALMSTPLFMVKTVLSSAAPETPNSGVESNVLRLVVGHTSDGEFALKKGFGPPRSFLSSEAIAGREVTMGLRRNEVTDDAVLIGFTSSISAESTWRRATSIRIRARVAAAELILAGVPKPTLPQIADCIGRSSRTLIDRFKVRDALFAFPPPELVPVLVDIWEKARTIEEFAVGLESAFGLLDTNPVALRLLRSLAAVHNEQEMFATTDGYFAAALRIELSRRGLRGSGVLHWTGFVTDALRDCLSRWSESTENLVSVVPKILSTLRPIALPASSATSSPSPSPSTVAG
jgi:hypothetical protein